MTAHPTEPLTKDNWHLHPRFPTQALLLGSHANFLRFSRALIAVAEVGHIPTHQIADAFARWIGAMRSHERYEEHKLYPYLQQRCGLDAAPLSQGHDELHERAEAVTRALRAPEGADLAEALRLHHEVLVRHLDLEEAAVIPPLLELSPEEFDRYARSTIDELLATP